MRLVVLGMMLLAQMASGGPPMAKPNCRDRCGDITIPYPFGMERRDCYMSKWFEIHCNRSKPFLPSLKLEVLNITIGTGVSHHDYLSELTVKGPIISNRNCLGLNGSHRPVNLTGSPFDFSRSSFTAVGCNMSAFMSYHMSSSKISGCNTGCIQGQQSLHQDWPLQVFSNSSNSTDCNDFNNCCQTTPSSYVFDPRFQPIDGNHSSSSGCSLAFIANNDWVSTQLYKQKELLYVPLSLSWTVFHYDIGFPNLAYTDCFSHTSVINETVIYVTDCVCVGGYEGNPYLECEDVDECQSPQIHHCEGITRCVNTPGSFKCINNPVWITVIIIAGTIGLLAIVFCIWCAYRLFERRNKSKLRKKFFKRNGGLLLQQQVTSMDGRLQKTKLFNSKELEKATDNFNKNRILGQGGQGTVYKGMLTDGMIVAVKKSAMIDEGNLQEFINEVVILTQINHRNVVKLLGCCLETEVLLLVYEFVPNGSLFHYIHGDQNEDMALSWEVRLQIATEVAGAVAYLHSEASIPIYHRDIKSANILLDEKFRAKVSDFGISRSITIDQTHLTTNVQGTRGYVDPEYFQSGHFTAKSDVYSFGIVLLELLTGQKPICSRRSEGRRSLATYFNSSMEDGELFDIVDNAIMQPKHEEQIVAVAILAKRCLSLHGGLRPDMKEVEIELEHIRSLSTQNIEEIVPLANASSSNVSCDNKDSMSLLSFEVEPVVSFQT